MWYLEELPPEELVEVLGVSTDEILAAFPEKVAAWIEENKLEQDDE